jgi:CDP-glycerol:poly(glycerophosphate) glycerophosphotransferase
VETGGGAENSWSAIHAERSEKPLLGSAVLTLFMVVHQGFVARFLLRTDILKTLSAAGVRVVVLAPNHDEAYLREELGDQGVDLEPLRADIGAVTRSKPWTLLFHLRTYTLARASATSALAERYEQARSHQRSQRRILAALIHAALLLLKRSRLARSLLLWLESRLYTPRLHRDLFERYRPDLVVTTSAGWFISDALVLREARREGVPTAVSVLSWDNPTSKGYRGAYPDRMIAWSERMADQIARHHDYPRDRIVASGVPHFDPYMREGALWSREELCSRLGLDPGRRLVLFAAGAPGQHALNLEVVGAIAHAVAEESLGFPAQLVVRLHPIYLRPDHMTPIDGFRELAERHPHTWVDVPDVASDRLRCDLPVSDSLRLGSLLKNCDVLVNVFSTTTLEAFLLDRPAVLVNPTGRDFAEYAHIRSVAQGKAALVAHSPAQAVEHIRTYLREPALHSEARRRVALEECGPSDGHAGERIAGQLLEQMGITPLGEATPAPSPEELSLRSS